MRKADAATPGEGARGQLMVVGLSYHTPSLEKREQLAPISEQKGHCTKPHAGCAAGDVQSHRALQLGDGTKGEISRHARQGPGRTSGYLSRRLNPTCSPNRARRRCGISSASSAVWTSLSSATSRSTARYAQRFV
jgi:hypothetical protein